MVVRYSVESEVKAVISDLPGVLFDFSLILAMITARLSSND